MATFRRAVVQYKTQTAGLIEERPDGSTLFAYEPGWTAPIACALPTVANVHPWRQGLHPFFQHLTAEGWLRDRQARTANLDQDDDLGLLLRYGRDCIGAVSVHAPDGDPPASPTQDLEPATRAAVAGRRTLSGVQKKLLVIPEGDRYRPAGPDGPAPFIAKFNSDDLPTLVRNEALTLELARLLLGSREVAESTHANVENIGHALIVTRFDRTKSGAKLRLEDLCQVLVRRRGPGEEHKYESSYEEAGQAIAAHSARPEIDRLRFFKLLVANVLLGNCDAHLKNFSLLERPEGLRLAPAYDIVNTLLYQAAGYSTRLALRIDGEYRQHDRVDRALLARLGRNLGIADQAVEQAFADLRRGSRLAIDKLRRRAASEPEPGFIDRYEQIVALAHQRIFADD